MTPCHDMSTNSNFSWGWSSSHPAELDDELFHPVWRNVKAGLRRHL